MRERDGGDGMGSLFGDTYKCECERQRGSRREKENEEPHIKISQVILFLVLIAFSCLPSFRLYLCVIP
jgi:hypothetical protein